jgi:hypothetical protein
MKVAEEVSGGVLAEDRLNGSCHVRQLNAGRAMDKAYHIDQAK